MTTSLPKNPPDKNVEANVAPTARRDAFSVLSGATTADRKVISDRADRDFARLLGESDASAVPEQGPATRVDVSQVTSAMRRDHFTIRESNASAASSEIGKVADGETVDNLPERAEIEAALSLLAPLWQLVAPAVAPTLTLSLERPNGSGAGQFSLSPQVLAALNQGFSGQGASLQAAAISSALLRELTVTEMTAGTELARRLSAPAGAMRTLDVALKPELLPGAPPIALRAEVVLSGGAVLSAAAKVPGSGTTPSSLPSALLGENNAGAGGSATNGGNAGNGASGKNFLKAGGKVVKPESILTGITGAQLPVAMTTAAPALPITASAVAPVSALTERFSAGQVPGIASSADGARMIAQRAVETVLNVVETQAASRLQPVPSVQLRFKFGNDDLAVRVEMRNGEVRTEFRSDSPELRAAIAQEWRAIPGRSETTLRFAEAVITNSGNANSHSGSNGSFSQGHPSSQHQRATQPDFFAGTGRAFPAPAPSTEPAAPVMLPTSKRLSAVA